MKPLLIISALALAGCQTTIAQTGPARVLNPVERCGDVQIPIYGILDRPSSDGEVLGGAIIGGVIGNQIGNGSGNDVATVIGAIIGAQSTANTRQQERVITGYKTKRVCRTVYQ